MYALILFANSTINRIDSGSRWSQNRNVNFKFRAKFSLFFSFLNWNWFELAKVVKLVSRKIWVLKACQLILLFNSLKPLSLMSHLDTVHHWKRQGKLRHCYWVIDSFFVYQIPTLKLPAQPAFCVHSFTISSHFSNFLPKEIQKKITKAFQLSKRYANWKSYHFQLFVHFTFLFVWILAFVCPSMIL